MGNDIEIRVRVANNTATGLAAVNRSLNNLRDEARDAGRGLDGLAARAAAASLALRSLKDSAQDASRALRSLNTTSRTTDGRLNTLSDRSRTLRRDTDDLDGSMRRLGTTMGDLRGHNGRLNATFGGSGNAMEKLRAAAISLSPALIPIAASAVPIIANVGAAGVAVGAFGLAIAGQLVAVKDAADAQQKYTDAVKKYGPASEQAAQAESMFLDRVKNMDPATRRAAAALSALKDQYKQWSKSLAGDTMPVFTKGLAVAGGLLPKLTPMVKGAAGELDRFMTILAGGVNSGGFSKFMESFAKFSTGALSKANDALVHFMRTMSGGTGSSQLSQFMDYVRKAGPQVGDTLLHLSEALVHVVAAASDTGLSMLTFVNAIAKLVNAIPSGMLSTFLQFAVALKAVKLAAAGMAALGGLSGVATAIGAMRTAAAGASGPLASLSAAFGALSRSAKIAAVGTGIGLLVVVLSRLADTGKKAPDVDRMTTSIGNLGRTGQVTGEALRVFGKDMDGLASAADRVAGKSSGMDAFNDAMNKIFTLGMGKSNSLKDAEKEIDALDKGLANLVKGGKPQLAAAALKELQAAYAKKGGDPKKLAGEMDDYKSALADAALEQKLTADSMGLFGTAAQATSKKLADQKASADGLRQSIQALNDVNRQGLGGMIGFEASIDAAAEAAKKNAGALSMTHGQLDLNSEKARNAASALQDLAQKTDEAAASARESGSSWSAVNGIYTRGRAALISNARAMGLNKTQAAALADQILKIPNKTARIKMNKEDAEAGLKAFNAAVRRSPGSKSVTLKTLSKSAEQILSVFGLHVKRLPNGSVKITAATGGALSAIRNVRAAVGSVHGKTVAINIVTTRTDRGTVAHEGGRYARGGRVRGYAGGGDVQAFPDGGYIKGPGSGTSDSILTLLGSGNVVRSSNTEFIVNARQTAKHRRLLELINSDRLPRFASGGATRSERQARNQARGDLTITHFGHKAGYQNTEFSNALGKPQDIGALVSALNHWRSVVMKSTHGSTERRLLHSLDSAGRSLAKYERKLTDVNKALDKAKDKLSSLKDSFKQLHDSVKSSVLAYASITRSAGGEGHVTTAGVMGGLIEGRDKAKSFADALKALKKKGLSGDLLAQIAQAGIEGGGLETAESLMSASKSEIKSMNDLQKQINGYAGKAGTTAADAMYGAGIKAAEGLVKGLEKQQDKIEKAMMKIAKSMEKAIKKALGIKSPSRVMLDIGHQTAEGFALGITRNRNVQPAWASMLNVPRGGTMAGKRATAAAAHSSGPRPVHEIVINLDGQTIARQIYDPLRKESRIRGTSLGA